MISAIRIVHLLLFAVAATTGLSPPGAVSFTGIGDLPGGSPFSSLQDLSGDGLVVVGMSSSHLGNQAFRWTSSEGIVGLGDLPGAGFSSGALGVSNDGRAIVGQGMSADSSPNVEAFLWTAVDGMLGLGDLPGGSYSSDARDASADGAVVVGIGSADVAVQAFRWTAQDGMVSLGTLPGGVSSSRAFAVSADGSVVTGWASSEFGREAYRWTADTGMVGLGDLPGGIFRSQASELSSDGSTIVGQGVSEDGFEAFIWTENEGMIGLGQLPNSFETGARGVTSDGSIVVGAACIGSGPLCLSSKPFIWDAEHGMRNLEDVLVENYGLDLADWSLRGARGISSDGLTIAGSGTNPDGHTEGWIVKLPDCNRNGIADDLDILDGTSIDADGDLIPDECQGGPCPAELNGDGIVDAYDLGLLLGAWGPNRAHPADFNADATVDTADLVVLVGHWGPCPE